MRKVLSTIGFFIVLIAQCFNALGQLYNFKNYTIEQGLPQSTVFCVTHDSQGYLWLGTEGGAARFNGSKFKVFDINNSLPGNTVRSIVEDANGSLWFGTDEGIAIYNGLDWQIINEEQGLQGSAVTKLLLDNKGIIWAATNDAGINLISIENDSIQIKHINQSKGLPGNFVFDLMLDGDEVWVAMIGGLSVVSYSDKGYEVRGMDDSISLPSSYISSIAKDSKGDFWIGTLDQGAFRWNQKTKRMEGFNYPNGVSDDRIWDIYCDSDSVVWFATEKSGVFKYSKSVIQQITTENGLLGEQIFCIHRDADRNLWFGSVGQGISMFQGFHLVHYSVEDGLPGTSVLAIKPDNDGQLWLGTNQHGLGLVTVKNDKLSAKIFDAKEGYKAADVTSIDINNQGRVLAGTRGNGLLMIDNTDFSYLTTADGLLNNNINCVYNAPNGSIYIGSDMGFNEIAGNQIHTISEKEGLINSEVQTVIADSDKNIWMGTLGGLASFRAETSVYRDFNEEEGLFDLGIHALVADKNNQLWIGTNNGIYTYSSAKDTIIAFTDIQLNSKTINSLLFFNDSTLIVGTVKGFNKLVFDSNLQKVRSLAVYDNSNGFIWSETNFNAICSDIYNHVWMGTVNGLTSYRPELEDTIIDIPTIHLTDILLSFKEVDWFAQGYKKTEWNNYPDKLSLPYNQNHLTFNFEGIYLRNPERVVYKYKLGPQEKEWSPAVKNTTVTYPGLSNGKYSFSVVVSADGVHWSKPLTYDFTIRPPFWKTIGFFIIVLLLLASGVVVYVRWREGKLIKEKAHLEKVVKERTAEVVAQKDEIQSQKEEITGSINYAQRIQRAILPGIENLREDTADSFILFKPCHIVSGDYYWVERLDNQLIVVAADCTGHGVPGAFMSMLGVSFLNKIVKEQKQYSPDIILGQMRENVISSLKQGDYAGSSKDGMDMALCVLNLDTLAMNFAGAYNPGLLIRNGEAEEIKADRMPVGYHIKMGDYTKTEMQLQKGDCIYMYSDGFQDQIGGPRERKFMRKNMRELLIEIHTKRFAEQHQILDTTITNWMNHPVGKTDQMDDILIVGFQV